MEQAEPERPDEPRQVVSLGGRGGWKFFALVFGVPALLGVAASQGVISYGEAVAFVFGAIAMFVVMTWQS